MKASHTLTELEQVKALADPLRLKILETFCTHGAQTTKQVAERLGEKVTKLYHHVDTLERLGFITLVETKQNRGTVEKYFEPIASRFVVDKELFDVMPRDEETMAEVESMLRNALESTITEVTATIAAGDVDFDSDEIALARLYIRASRKRIKTLQRRLQKLLKDLEALDDDDEDEEEVKYGLTLVFYPMVDDQADEKNGGK